MLEVLDLILLACTLACKLSNVWYSHSALPHLIWCVHCGVGESYDEKGASTQPVPQAAEGILLFCYSMGLCTASLRCFHASAAKH